MSIVAGSAGIVIRLTVMQPIVVAGVTTLQAIDLSAATTLEIFAELSNTPSTRTVIAAAFPAGGDGTDGVIEITTTSTTFPTTAPGTWRAQAHVVIGARDFVTSAIRIPIEARI